MCQETSPEASEGPVPSSPSRSSPLPPSLLVPTDPDLESQPPVIHDIVTSSPNDNEHLGAMPFVTNIDMGAPLDIPVTEPEPELSPAPLTPESLTSAKPVLDTPADIGPIPESPVLAAKPDISIPTETIKASDPPSHAEADISPSAESSVPLSPVSESPVHDSHQPDTPGSAEAVEEPDVVEDETELPEEVSQVEREEGMGLFRRKI